MYDHRATNNSVRASKSGHFDGLTHDRKLAQDSSLVTMCNVPVHDDVNITIYHGRHKDDVLHVGEALCSAIFHPKCVAVGTMQRMCRVCYVAGHALVFDVEICVVCSSIERKKGGHERSAPTQEIYG